MAELQHNYPIGTAPANQVTNQGSGATFNPIYVERRPIMWAISETDLKSMAALSEEATRHFAFASFLAGVLANILLGYCFATGQLSEIANFMLYRASWLIVVFVLVFIVFGLRATYEGRSILKQIKAETKQVTQDPTPQGQ